MTSPHTRRPSFGMLLRRSKSGEFGGKGSKKVQAVREAELERQRRAAAARVAPKLPEFLNNADHFARNHGPEAHVDPGYSLATGPLKPGHRAYADAPRDYVTNPPPLPPIPYDPYARNESITNRGRHSYASSSVSAVNNPRRVRRRRDPTPFNVLIVGTSGSGKTSFLEFLKTALALPANKRPIKRSEPDGFILPTPASGSFVPHYVESEIDGERVGLTLWDSEGLERNLVDLQLREMNSFIESKFEDTFAEEMKVVRSPGTRDTHIHAVFMVLDPARLDSNLAAARKANGLHTSINPRQVYAGLNQDLELQVFRHLYGKTTVIPIIAKADTITTKHMNVLKTAFWESIKREKLDPLKPLGLDVETGGFYARVDGDDDDDDGPRNAYTHDDATDASDADYSSASESLGSQQRSLSTSGRQHRDRQDAKDLDADPNEPPFLPLTVISPDLYEPDVIGRQFPWGLADPYNDQHCDFQQLKEAVFSEWRVDLREASRDRWYESWRTSRLGKRATSLSPL